VISFELEHPAAVRTFAQALRLPKLAVSLGGVESIVSFPATMSHASMPTAERAARGVTDTLLRLSVGLESAADLMDDLGQALDAAAAAIGRDVVFR